MMERYVVLQALAEFSISLGELRGLLESLEWDFDNPPFVINRTHICNVLDRYLKRKVSSKEVEDWANLIEGRDDVVFDDEDSETLGEHIYELANPKLTQQLSAPRARELIRLLS